MRNHSIQGFSLIELLIATALAALIGSAVLLVLVQQAQLTSTQNRNMLNAEQVRGVMNFMADEIEMMGNAVPAPWIENASPQDFTFRGDIDGDGKPDKIRYFLTGTNLQRTLSTSPDNGVTWNVVGTDTLIPNIDITATKTVGGQPNVKTGFQFTYFARNGATPANTTLITAVQINLGLNTALTQTALNKGKQAPQYFVTLATIRNRSL